MSTPDGGNVIMAGVGRGVSLRGVSVPLDSDVGGAFVADCARHTEGLVSDSDIKCKWALSEEDWTTLATNTPLLDAVRTERERRIRNGDAARESAQRLFAKAPSVLGEILTDNLSSPRNRIEAAKELRQVAANGPDTSARTGEKFIIHIDLGGGDELHFEKDVAPREPLPSNDGEGHE